MPDTMLITLARRSLQRWIEGQSIDPSLATLTSTGIVLVAVVLVAFVADKLVSYGVRNAIQKAIKALSYERAGKWEAALRRRFVANRSASIVRALILMIGVPQSLDAYPALETIVSNIIEGYLVLVILVVVTSVLRAASDVMMRERTPTSISISIGLQALRWAVMVVGGILIVAVVFDKSVTVLLSGMAGMTAVTMLVFRDSLLGFVAGIQLTSNELVSVGDWIEVPQCDADGTVIDIGLTTVKVQNFDKTISSVPTYTLLTESFRNWRGMRESGGRRIERSISIDMETIGFIDDNMLERLEKSVVLRDYIAETMRSINEFNSNREVAPDDALNARRLTNIGLFRKYVEQYLQSHPKIRKDMTFVVRQREPGPNGIPIEILVFSSEQEWRAFETLQADIIDHLLAVVSEFGLRVFQSPSSDSMRIIGRGVGV